MPNRASRVPEDSRVALWLAASDEEIELSVEDSTKVLRRYPSLLHLYLKYRGMTQSSGRLIVIDQRRVSKILAWLDLPK